MLLLVSFGSVPELDLRAGPAARALSAEELIRGRATATALLQSYHMSHAIIVPRLIAMSEILVWYIFGMTEEEKRRRGRPPKGVTPKRNIRVGEVWDEAEAI